MCKECKHHAKWVIVEKRMWYQGGIIYACSECGVRYSCEELEGVGGIESFNYCPKCGAYIEEDEP